jgi:hypothetical protein
MLTHAFASAVEANHNMAYLQAVDALTERIGRKTKRLACR